MLSTPRYGWTEISIGDFRGRGSHIQNIPVLLLEAFLRALRWHIPAEITIDEEGSTFDLCSLYTTTIAVHRGDDELHHFDIDVQALASELIADLRRDWQDWLCWPEGCTPTDSPEHRAAHLTRLINESEKYL